ncbi:unnamed protein product [Didymodactylos carnosus]|uniref:Uncharacterized protein n=1 Tax=Didymodactylos carnosus TaxID=1234261 RepID=A0A813QKP6_9BILA|nr:unnamed protein product [Didymodactylos carnosus]CAF1032669.1 unnamed protein product [Didymodactylos carnosus]CAF3550770.1 unnamed protein product [Didymodactylos carnosus]CAF3800937.1 unnamed protein product [Didymodactylos carnosus]
MSALVRTKSVDSDYDHLLKFIVLGDLNVGKTTYLYHFVHNTYSNFKSTVGIDFYEKRVTFKSNINIGAKYRLKLLLWDSAGQERYRSLTTSLFRDIMGFILMFDVTNESTFLSVRNWITFIQTHCYNSEPQIILIGNKIDADNRRFVDTVRAKDLADELHVVYIETSSVTGHNVKESMELLIEQTMNQMELATQKYYKSSSTIDIREMPTKSKTLMKKLYENKNQCNC